MATPSQKLADSLEALKALQDAGIVAIRSADLGRTHRERLLRAGFLHEVMKGWYIPARDDQSAGESTGWYTSYWDFCAAYLEHRFGDRWCLSPEHSLALHVGNRAVPQQLLVHYAAGRQQANDSAAQYLTLRCPLYIAGQKKHRGHRRTAGVLATGGACRMRRGIVQTQGNGCQSGARHDP